MCSGHGMVAPGASSHMLESYTLHLEIAWTLYSPEVRHRAVSASGILGGTTSGPAVWMPNGTGGYTVTTLANAGAVNGVRRDGGMLVGFTSGPVYWLAQPGGRWSAPVAVAGGCFGIKDIADAGRILSL